MLAKKIAMMRHLALVRQNLAVASQLKKIVAKMTMVLALVRIMAR